MIPIFICPEATRIALIGRGERAESRLRWLRDGGADPDVWSDHPTDVLVHAAGSRLRRSLLTVVDVRRYHLIWIADLPNEFASTIAAMARVLHVLVNVEDAENVCDFHSPAIVRRGALTLAAGTGGASPAVARLARERLEQVFAPAWGEALHSIAQTRKTLRQSGATSSVLAADARAQLIARGLI